MTSKVTGQKRKESKEKNETPWDCFAFPCGDSCCQYGADVYPNERDFLISAGQAAPSDFLGPTADEKGDMLYRTRTGLRGCVFLSDERGCRLHLSGHKPQICRVWPRNFREAKRAAGEGYLPCFEVIYKKELADKKKTR